MITTPPEMRALLADLTNAVWSLAAIGVLFDSGLADQLTEPRTVDELAASSTALPPRRIENILGLAAAHGVVVADGPRYRLADGVVPIVLGPMRTSVAGDIRSHLMQPLAFLDSAKASAPTTTWRHTDPVVLQAQGDASSVLPMMIKTMMAPMLGDLAARLEKPDAKFLDIGTGVGALAVATCKAYPAIQVVGLDPFEAPLELARANCVRAGVRDRVELRQLAVQDLRDEATYACAWLPAFFIAPDALPAALARVAAALEPGGWLLMGTPGGGDAKQRGVWKLLGELWGGLAPTAAEGEALLREAGLREVRTLPGPPWGPQMIVGQR